MEILQDFAMNFSKSFMVDLSYVRKASDINQSQSIIRSKTYMYTYSRVFWTDFNEILHE